MAEYVQHKIAHVFKFPAGWKESKIYQSPSLILSGLDFRIRVGLHLQNAQKCITFGLICLRDLDKPGADTWSCSFTKGILRIIGETDADTFEFKGAPYTFHKAAGYLGLHLPNQLIWDDVMAKYMHDDEVHIVISFNVNPPLGFDYKDESLEETGKGLISSDLLNLYESRELTDIVLKSKDGHEFSCHQLILSARSSVFKAMFLNDMKEKTEGVVNMEELDGNSLTLFCSYLYSGSLTDADNDMEQKDIEVWMSLTKAADMYELHHLRDLASRALVLRRTAENAWDIMNFLKQFEEEKVAFALRILKQFFIRNVKDILGEGQK